MCECECGRVRINVYRKIRENSRECVMEVRGNGGLGRVVESTICSLPQGKEALALPRAPACRACVLCI